MRFLFLPALPSPNTRWSPGGASSNQFLGVAAQDRVRHSVERVTKATPYEGVQLLNWMDKELKGTDNYYPHMLLSYYYFRQVPLKFPEDGFVSGDSGGFSLLTRGDFAPTLKSYTLKGTEHFYLDQSRGDHQRHMDPLDVLTWQAAHCDVGMILDKPPWVEGNVATDFDKALDVTVRNVKRALPRYERLRKEGSKFRWWGVVQGQTVAQLRQWWKTLSAVYPFNDKGEGWGFPVRAKPKQLAIARVLHFVRKQKIKNVHILGASGPAAVATLLVLGERAGVKFLTADAQTAATAATNRRVYSLSDNGLHFHQNLRERGDERVVRDHLLACTCWSCSQIAGDAKRWPDALGDVEYGEFNEYWKFRFHFHNFIMHNAGIRNLERAAIEQPAEMLQGLLKRNYWPVLRAFDGTEPHTATSSRGRSLLDLGK